MSKIYPLRDGDIYFRPHDYKPEYRGRYLLKQDDLFSWSAQSVTSQNYINLHEKQLQSSDESNFIVQMVRLLEQEDVLSYGVWFW